MSFVADADGSELGREAFISEVLVNQQIPSKESPAVLTWRQTERSYKFGRGTVHEA